MDYSEIAERLEEIADVSDMNDLFHPQQYHRKGLARIDTESAQALREAAKILRENNGG